MAGTFEGRERRIIAPREWETIGKLAAATPDLTKVEPQLLAALKTGAGAAGAPLLRPANWRELMEAVRLGVISPKESRRFLALPRSGPGLLARLARLWWQRIGRGDG